MEKQKLIRHVFSLCTLCDVIYITKNSQTLPLTLLSVRCHLQSKNVSVTFMFLCIVLYSIVFRNL